MGTAGCIGGLAHIMNESRIMSVRQEILKSNWNHSVFFRFADTTDILSFAPIFAKEDEGDAGMKKFLLQLRQRIS